MSLKRTCGIALSNTSEFVVKHKRGILIGVAIVLVLALLFTALFFTGVFDDRSKAIEELEAPTIAFTEGAFHGGYYIEISGKIRNKIHSEIKIVTFRFTLFDGDGKQITDQNGNPIFAEDRVSNLASGGEYSYKATNIVPKTTKLPITFQIAKSDINA